MTPSAAAVMVSRRCNMKCSHCSVESSPQVKGQPEAQELRNLIKDLVAQKPPFIQFTGGEPMLREELVFELMRLAQEGGIPCTMVSNGFWGKKPDKARDTLARLLQAGMSRLSISYDRFHAEFQGPQPALNIIEAARDLGTEVHIHITRSKDDSDLDAIVEPFRNIPNAHLRFYDLQAVGFARNLKESLRGQLSGFCSSCEQATFTDDGRVTACNGPAYFQKSHSALIVGEYGTGKTPVAELMQKHAKDPILQTIRTDGPIALRATLENTPGFESFPWKEHYSGMCELCLQITSSPEAVEALRRELSEPVAEAERLARSLVLQANRRQSYNRFQVNKHLAPVMALKLARGADDPRFEKVFGRADLDWEELSDRLRLAGLLPLLQSEHAKSVLRDWAPLFFWRRVAEAGNEIPLEHVREVLTVAHDLGLELETFGATTLWLKGSPRSLDTLQFTSPLRHWGRARALLKERLDHGVELLAPTEAALEGDNLTAWQLLWEWRRQLFKQGLETAFDLGRLATVDWHAVLEHAGRQGQRSCLSTAFEALAQEAGLPSESVKGLRKSALVKRVVSYQFCRANGDHDNAFLELAVGLSSLDGIRGLLPTMVRGIKAIAECDPRQLGKDAQQARDIYLSSREGLGVR